MFCDVPNTSANLFSIKVATLNGCSVMINDESVEI